MAFIALEFNNNQVSCRSIFRQEIYPSEPRDGILTAIKTFRGTKDSKLSVKDLSLVEDQTLHQFLQRLLLRNRGLGSQHPGRSFVQQLLFPTLIHDFRIRFFSIDHVVNVNTVVWA